MSSPIRLASITLDCEDASTLADFWRQLLELEVEYAAEDGSAFALRGEGFMLSCVQVDGYRPPAWPAERPEQQMHLDLYADDLDHAARRAVELGGRVPEEQPQPDQWLVLLDPAGHPFCFMPPFG
ncbi:VOC family protein [Luteococcus peritonei]|uniref:VOC family protein n=1 Tax=Luteococcus peritonei TaxID=88874 RepID=A0ABW4RYJ1_9ACTN